MSQFEDPLIIMAPKRKQESDTSLSRKRLKMVSENMTTLTPPSLKGLDDTLNASCAMFINKTKKEFRRYVIE
ncbi:hypothetical protein PRIPAC_71945 [Pristionchus pacificus]|uniref:Uncharacterized protein n=1 Tax=Pristionchus pacificus TaxID=54126 RepID=A0A2A6CRC8_PRIPA|nr:hypothetical protein PRIPAC_71945 [Pristionchus pacificus]|eukprot:PDM80772.1 hypothetical protein PRIPAC_35775 [Pristionchus pacificus]